MRKRIASLAFALSMLVPGSVNATTVMKVDTGELAATSQWVVRATVLSVRNVDLRHAGRALFTDVELAFTEIYGGKSVPSRYTLRLIGGKGADGTTMKIPGMPTFQVGEDVVLFLEKTPTGHIPCGLGQGVYRVLHTPSGDAWVRQSVGHVNMVKRGPSGRLETVKPSWDDVTMPLETLIYRIHSALLGDKLLK